MCYPVCATGSLVLLGPQEQCKGRDMMWLLSAAGGPPRTGPTACGIRSWGQWRVQSLGGSWGELLPGAGTACAAGTGTAQHIPSSAVCKLSCGKVATKYLIFFLIFFFPSPCLAGAPQRRRCMAEGSWRALSLSSQPRRCPLPAVTGARVGEPSHDKPSRGPAVNDGSCPSLPGLETPLSTRWLNMRLGPPCIMCWLNKGEGLAGLSGEA